MSDNSTTLSDLLKSVEKLNDHELSDKVADLRSSSQPGLTSALIDRWYNTEVDSLKSILYQYFLDTKNQNELEFFIDAIKNDNYSDKRSDLISVLWQSSLDASEHLEELVNLAIQGDIMTIIEVGTVIDSFDSGFEDQEILEAKYQVSEAMGESSDDERVNLLGNLQQIISELYAI